MKSGAKPTSTRKMSDNIAVMVMPLIRKVITCTQWLRVNVLNNMKPRATSRNPPEPTRSMSRGMNSDLNLCGINYENKNNKTIKQTKSKKQKK